MRFQRQILSLMSLAGFSTRAELQLGNVQCLAQCLNEIPLIGEVSVSESKTAQLVHFFFDRRLKRHDQFLLRLDDFWNGHSNLVDSSVICKVQRCFCFRKRSFQES